MSLSICYFFSLQVASCSEPVPIPEGNGWEHQEEKAVKDGEREAFVFGEGAKVYRCMSDPDGYIPMPHVSKCV